MANKNTQKLLREIRKPFDLKKLSIEGLESLALEIRDLLTSTIAKNGGHLSPNLGVVELTLTLHKVYNSPKDKIIFDVGHQSYVHKILTGRFEKFANIRSQGGLSGYPSRFESEHDPFGNGHVGSAVSAALGFAEGRDVQKEKYKVVAVIGDGSLTNGMTYEALNNASNRNTDITIVLNDNNWSISKNIGGISRYLTKISDRNIQNIETIFELLGFKYFGPIDGHDIDSLSNVLEKAKNLAGPKIVHVITQKGRGFSLAETRPDKFHFATPFEIETGENLPGPSTSVPYSSVLADALVKIAHKNKKVVAVTAAMGLGTGTEKFREKFPERFFDVGIAEEHAVTFAAGLALSGLKPVVAIYSTFLQRCYDQIIHDVVLQKAPVIFAIARAGIGTDGASHNGLFDLSYLRSIPGLIVLAPKDKEEFQDMLYTATLMDAPVAIRFPKDAEAGELHHKPRKMNLLRSEELCKGKSGTVIAVGSMVRPAFEACESLRKEGVNLSFYDAKSIKPLDKTMIKKSAKTGKIITVEENILDGGFGSAVLEELEKLNIYNIKIIRLGVGNFVPHGNPNNLKKELGLDVTGLKKKFKSFLQEKK